jgi:hypothetical protein
LGQPFTNTLEHTGLFVQESNGRLLFNSELGTLVQMRKPDQIAQKEEEPDPSRSFEYGWKLKGQADGLSTSAALATGDSDTSGAPYGSNKLNSTGQ